jgi:hypothetical protein
MADGGTGGLLGNTWIKTGPGTVTNSVGYLSIISDNLAYTSAAQEATVVPGRLHRFSYTGEGFSFSRKVGAAQEGGEYIPLAAGTLGINTHTFTPTTNKVWVQFQRLSKNTAIANDLRLTDLQPPNLAARSLNGTSQFFYQDNAAFGFPMLNANFFIGGWWKFTTLPTTGGVYIYDFGSLLQAGSGGDGRVRLVYDGAQNRLVASNKATSGNYREEHIQNPAISVNVPVFLGLGVQANGHAYPVIGNQRGGGVIVGSLPTIQNDLGKQIRIGANARTTPAAGTYANGSVWDVFWHTGSIPSDAVLSAMASGQRPHQITNYTPTYLWPMAAQSATMDEDSITGLSTMRQVASPGVVAAPPPEVVVSETLGCIII